MSEQLSLSLSILLWAYSIIAAVLVYPYAWTFPDTVKKQNSCTYSSPARCFCPFFSFCIIIHERFLFLCFIVFSSPDVILCGWLGSNHKLINYLSFSFNLQGLSYNAVHSGMDSIWLYHVVSLTVVFCTLQPVWRFCFKLRDRLHLVQTNSIPTFRRFCFHYNSFSNVLTPPPPHTHTHPSSPTPHCLSALSTLTPSKQFKTIIIFVHVNKTWRDNCVLLLLSWLPWTKLASVYVLAKDTESSYTIMIVVAEIQKQQQQNDKCHHDCAS